MVLIKRVAALLLTIITLTPLTACTGRDSYQSRVIYSMNTPVEIYIAAGKDAAALLDDCEKLVYEIENEVSRTRSLSNVALLNELSSAECGVHTLALLQISYLVYGITGGAFDPTIQPLTELWKSLDGGDTLPETLQLSALLEKTGMEKLRIDGTTVTAESGTRIDLGGIAKGYAAQLVIELINKRADEYSITGGIISFGGAVSVFGVKKNGTPYRVALRDPDDKNGTFGYVSLSSGHVSVSGDYERYVTIGGIRYHHIINPETGYPAQSGLRSVSVICSNGALSDALSTALFILGYDKSMELYRSGAVQEGFEAVFMLSDGTVKTTPGAGFTQKK